MNLPSLPMTNDQLAAAIEFTFLAYSRTAELKDERRAMIVKHLSELLEIQRKRALMAISETQPTE